MKYLYVLCHIDIFTEGLKRYEASCTFCVISIYSRKGSIDMKHLVRFVSYRYITEGLNRYEAPCTFCVISIYSRNVSIDTKQLYTLSYRYIHREVESTWNTCTFCVIPIYSPKGSIDMKHLYTLSYRYIHREVESIRNPSYVDSLFSLCACRRNSELWERFLRVSLNSMTARAHSDRPEVLLPSFPDWVQRPVSLHYI
jgi:hypothetical protein